MAYTPHQHSKLYSTIHKINFPNLSLSCFHKLKSRNITFINKIMIKSSEISLGS